MVLMAGASIVCSPGAVAGDKADTTRKMMRLPAAAAKEKARRDLLSILQAMKTAGALNAEIEVI